MQKNPDFWQKNPDISKIKRELVIKVHVLKLHVCVYLRAKFEVSSIILTSFILTTSKLTPKKPTQIRVKLLTCKKQLTTRKIKLLNLQHNLQHELQLVKLLP